MLLTSQSYNYFNFHTTKDRTRKEFEKWVTLTYSNNRAIINEKKDGDGGIDGVAFMLDLDRKKLTTLQSTTILMCKCWVVNPHLLDLCRDFRLDQTGFSQFSHVGFVEIQVVGQSAVIDEYFLCSLRPIRENIRDFHFIACTVYVVYSLEHDLEHNGQTED